MPDQDTLRPTNLAGYVGQHATKELLLTHMEAACQEERRLPHVLLLGPPGSGKTTLAGIIASMMGAPYEVVAAPPTRDGLIDILLRHPVGVLFIDECHLIPKAIVDSVLLTLLEEQYVDAKFGRLEFPKLTVIAATTEREQVRKPLRQRFPLQPQFEDYTVDQLARIACDMSARAGLKISFDQAELFGRAAGGVPRQVRTMVLHAKALQTSRKSWSVDDVLVMASVHEDGLTVDHVDYLTRLSELRGQAGLATMSSRLRLPESEVRDLEKLLLDRQLITLTSSGRQITQAGITRVREAEAA